MVPSHTMRQAVAISTTGDEHRLGFLETSVKHWDAALRAGDSLFVTVDGNEEAAARVAAAVYHWTGSVYQVGGVGLGIPDRMRFDLDGRQGVAANKNTGLELMMDNTRADHLFLCDDDTYPKSKYALVKHTEMAQNIPHSMVCWGKHRLQHRRGHYATWTWPRGVLLYARRHVVEKVGGMVEEFGPGGHEHVEWSRRIHQHGLTPAPFITSSMYAERGPTGEAHRAEIHWHCEDMRQPSESSVELRNRRKAITSVRRADGDWANIERIMAEMDGNTSFVPFRAHENGRSSATLCATSTGQGAGGEQ